MTEYLAMGGHAVWIWSAYAIAFITLALMIYTSFRHARVQRDRLAAIQAKEDRNEA